MSLKAVVKKRIVDNVFNSVYKAREWKVLVINHLSMRMVSSCMKMHDLLDVGITLVENIEKHREPIPQLEAVYLLTPTQHAIDELIEDFDEFFRNYKAAHIFFTEVCPDELLIQLRSIRKFVKTLKEIDIAFLPSEVQVFSLDNPVTFNKFYSPTTKNTERNEHMEKISEQLATLCASLGEFPAIRYNIESPKMAEFARLVKTKLDLYKVDDPQIGEGSREKYQSQLILLDRAFDPISPLVHELTYQAMAYDLLSIKNDVYKYSVGDSGETEEKEALLDENDDMWADLRHLHIADVSRKVPEAIKEFSAKEHMPSSENKMKDLQNMLKKAPQYKEQVKKFITHFNLAEGCMRNYHQVADKLCAVEQDLATSFDKDGEKVKDPMKNIVPVLLDPSVSMHDKVRIILLYILFKNGVSEENLEKLCDHAQIPQDERPDIRNMVHLGIPVIDDASRKKKKPARKERTETFYLLSRWVPYVKDIMEDAIDGTLSDKLFPFLTKRTPTAATAKTFPAVSARHGQAARKEVPVEGRCASRLIVFIVGGVSYSETRSAYEVTSATKAREGWEVLIGSDQISTPKGFLANLRNLTAS